MFKYYRQSRQFIKNNEQYLSPLLMFCGFVVDNLTLRRIDLLVENILILAYLLVALICIIYINYYDGRDYVTIESNFGKSKIKKLLDFKKHKETTLEKLSIFAPLVMQFAFGGLFSVFIVFYVRSASIFTSWPFLIFLFVLLIGNEFFRERYQRLTFQISIFFIAIFSYSVFAVPILMGQIGVVSFLFSGGVSLILISFVLQVIKIVIPKKFKLSKRNIYRSISGLYLVFNMLYFLNIIPPIPLSLTDDGLFHSLDRNGNFYNVEFEASPWYDIFNEVSSDFHWKSGTPVYYYSAVFAPTKISTKIYHRWSYYIESENKWEVKSLLDYPIVGGRDGGFRGYSYKYGIQEGEWRVDVVTQRGQVLGRKTFNIVKVDEVPELKSGEK